MKSIVASAAALAVSVISPALAQEVQAQAELPAAPAQAMEPVVATPRAELVAQTALPANTEILVSMNEDLTTKGGRIEEGHKFGLSVVHDVMVDDYVVIPRGTPAVGEVTWKTGKGAFGKSGKMEIALRYVDLKGRRIPINGTYRQEGEGNTVATVAGVVLAGVFAGFITGKSARIPQGRELKAYTAEAVPVAIAAPAVMQAPAANAPSVTPASE